ncbi:1039_t:CDS:2 [Scutellospora calospora]|uniref:1039_t:CDS:1 n=1 Tax=Scutellospora calospora TaxID=85575 RepID=A0ACA9MY06_9GLOM|nr:1039_t:CDS:2 [Scutellospora calospora]
MGEHDAPPVPALKRASKGDGNGVPNFSRRGSVHRDSNGNGQKNLTENEMPPPVPSNPNGRDLVSVERQANQPSDLERDTIRSPDSGPPFTARRAEDLLRKPPLPSRPSEWLTTLYTVSHLIFFSILGTLARLGVQWFSFYPGTPIVTPVLWANVGGGRPWVRTDWWDDFTVATCSGCAQCSVGRRVVSSVSRQPPCLQMRKSVQTRNIEKKETSSQVTHALTLLRAAPFQKQNAKKKKLRELRCSYTFDAFTSLEFAMTSCAVNFERTLGRSARLPLFIYHLATTTA